MTVTVKHPFVSTVPDSADTSLVRPSNWNADHTIIGLGTAAEKDAGVANGVATLDGGGTVPLTQIPASIQGSLNYQGTWNASTNTPTLASGVGTKGYYYAVSVAGSTNLDGITNWNIGDMAVYSGTAWQKIDNTDAVTSVNGYTGTVVLGVNDISGAANAPTNTNITSMTGVTGGISSPDFIQFDVAPSTIPTTPGALYWDNSDSIQSLNLVMAGATATQHIGEETYYRVKASSAITNGQVVMFTGTLGSSGGLTAAPATGLTAATASYIMGIATQDIPLNGWGYITHFGEVKQIDTSAFSAGDILYYDPTTPGGLTATLPSAPNAKIQVCAVVNSSPTVGILFVRPAFGGYLGQYEGDVQITSPANGQLLVRDQTAGKWVNSALDLSSPPTIGNTTPNSGAFTTLSSTGNTTLGDASTDTVTINGSATANAPVVVSTNSSSTALRITQVGTGNALVVEDSTNPDATPFVVDANGQVVVGGTSLQTIAGITAFGLQQQGGATANYGAIRYTNDAAGPRMFFAKSRGTTTGTNTVVQSSDELGWLRFNGADGTNIIEAASILAQVDGTPGTNDMPGRLVFSTTADGASSPTERMRIDRSGQIGIGAVPSASVTFDIAKVVGIGAGTAYGVWSRGATSPTTTSSSSNYVSTVSTASNGGVGYTVGTLVGFRAIQGTLNADSTVTSQYGFEAQSSLTGATNNYGFYSNIASGTRRWNFYANGTAANYLAGGVIINNNLGVGAAGSPSYGTSGQVLTSAGAGAAPTWSTPVSSNITATGLWENAATISSNYTIGSGNNAVSAGPITIASGVTVTVPSGSVWAIV